MNKAKNYLNFLFNWGLYFLVIILFLLLLVGAKTISELIYPTFILIKTMFIDETDSLSGMTIFAISVRFLLLLCTAYLVFLTFSIITTILSYNSYKSSAVKYDYKKFPLDTILNKGFKWNLYRIYYVLFPPMVVLVTGILLFLAFLYFFNFYLLFAGWSLGLVTFITCFLFTALLFCFIFALILSLYNLISTLFGMECAVSEPNLPNDTIKNRSVRLSFNKSSNFLLYLLYFIFIISILTQFIVSIVVKNSINADNLAMIFIANLIFLFALSRFKAHLYIESLMKQYKMITFNNY